MMVRTYFIRARKSCELALRTTHIQLSRTRHARPSREVRSRTKGSGGRNKRRGLLRNCPRLEADSPIQLLLISNPAVFRYQGNFETTIYVGLDNINVLDGLHSLREVETRDLYSLKSTSFGSEKYKFWKVIIRIKQRTNQSLTRWWHPAARPARLQGQRSHRNGIARCQSWPTGR